MSVKLSSWVWDGCAASGVKGIKLLIMARLADFSSDEGICWPSVDTIARQTGGGRSTVITAIGQLEKDGWLTRTERRKGQRNETNIYTLNRQKLKEAAERFEGSDSGRSENSKKRGCQGSDSERSKSEGSNPERSENSKKPGSHGSESGHDPSLKPDPSLNPTHSAPGDVSGGPVPGKPIPDYPGQSGMNFSTAPGFGKFAMTPGWEPSADFRQRAAYWGSPVPETLSSPDLKAALASFTDYWIAEGKVFNQVQWEQKFARHLQTVKPLKPRGNNRAGLVPTSTANATVQRMQAVRAQQLRARGESVEILAGHGGNIFEPVGTQKRLGPVGPMDCSDWEFDQRPDDERL